MSSTCGGCRVACCRYVGKESSVACETTLFMDNEYANEIATSME